MNSLGCIVEANTQRHAALSQEFSNVNILSNPSELDATKICGAVIATPVSTHYQVAKELLAKKIPLLIEKPTTTQLSETEELLDIAKKQELPLMTGFLLLYQPAIQKIKELLESEAIGEVKSFNFTRANFGRARGFENAFWSLGVHDVAVFSYLCADTLAQVATLSQNQRNETAPLEDDVRVNLSTSNGTTAHFHSTWNYPFMRRELMICGTTGILHYDEVKNELTHHKKTFSKNLENVDQGSEVYTFDKVEALELELRDFLNSIENKQEARAGETITLRVAQILERISNG